MQRARVDDRRHAVALLDPRPRAEATDNDRFALAHTDLGFGSFCACVLRKLARLVRLRMRTLDREVGHDLGAERLAQLEPAVQATILWGVRLEVRVFEVLRADADDHLLSLVAA